MNDKISRAAPTARRPPKPHPFRSGFLGRVPAPDRPFLADYGRLVHYGLALGTVAAALIVTAALGPRSQPPTIFFFVAVIVTSWYAGERAGIAAIFLSIVAIDFLFVYPFYSFRTLLFNNSVDLLAFALGTWTVSRLQKRWRQTHRTLVTVEYELKIARHIQQHFFPSDMPVLGGFAVAGACFPAAATGGDFFDYIPMADGCLGIAVGDVSGHGVGPALGMALVRAYLRALALTQVDPGDILTEANRLVYRDMEDECFVTVFLASFDPQSHTLRYAAAGQEAFLLEASGKATTLTSTGLPLAVEADATIACGASWTMAPEQILLLLSDGIPEATAADGEPFGTARAMSVVQAHRRQPAREIVTALYRAARAFRGAAQEDDMTIVVVKGAEAAAPPTAGES